MQDDELEFLEEMLASNELLHCSTCGEDTLHAHEEVVTVLPVGTELKMQCTHCQTSRTWFDWTPAQSGRIQN
jgi:hypothetical protein